MCFKKLSIIAGAGCAAALGLLLLSPGYGQVVDCVLAEVNGRIITLTDVQVMAAFSPELGEAGKPGPTGLREAFDEAVNRKVVLDLVQASIIPTAEEVAAQLEAWKERSDPGEWRNKLARFGFAESDLWPYLEELVLFNKIIGLRFTPSFDVNIQEIEKYYEEIYVPSERALNREPRPMVQILDELEARLKREKTSQQVAQWIQDLRAQAEVRMNDGCLAELK